MAHATTDYSKSFIKLYQPHQQHQQQQDELSKIKSNLEELFKQKDDRIKDESLTSKFTKSLINIVSNKRDQDQNSTPQQLQNTKSFSQQDQQLLDIQANLKKLELKSKSKFKVSQSKKEKGLNQKRYREIEELQEDPLYTIFNDHIGYTDTYGQQDGSGHMFDMRKMDFLKLNFKQQIDKMTQELIDQAQESELGRQTLKNSKLKNHAYVADLAVAKISKNLQQLDQLEQRKDDTLKQKSGVQSKYNSTKHMSQDPLAYQTIAAVNSPVKLILEEPFEDQRQSFFSPGFEEEEKVQNYMNQFKFHNPKLIKVNLANNFHRKVIAANIYCYEDILDHMYTDRYIVKSTNNQLYRQELDFDNDHSFQQTRNSFGLIFGSFPSEPGARQRLKNDFTAVDRKYMREFRIKRHHNQTKLSETTIRESSSHVKTIHTSQVKDKTAKSAVKAKKENTQESVLDMVRVEVTKEFEMNEEDEFYKEHLAEKYLLQQQHNYYDPNDSHPTSRNQSILPPLQESIHKLVLGRNTMDNKDDDENSIKDVKDLSFIGLEFNNALERGPSSNIGGLNILNNDNLIFYDERLEEDAYDQDLIEEMFNPRKKIKISKEHRPVSRSNTDMTYETNTTQTYNGVMPTRYQSKYGERMMSTQRDVSAESLGDGRYKQEKTLRKSFLASKDKNNFQYLLEFFEPLAKAKKKKQKENKKSKASPNLALQNKKIAADSANYNDLGMINFYGNVTKQRFKYNKFHNRWVVLRGFNLYWYRSPMDKSQKGMVTLPSVPVDSNARVGVNKCFMISRGEGKEGRQMKFLENDQNQDFKLKISNMIYYKMYLEGCQRKFQKLDSQVVNYFTDHLQLSLDFKDKNLNEEHKIANIFDAFTVHPRLQQLALVNCGLSDDSLDVLLFKLRQQKNEVQYLDLSQNDLTQHSMASIQEYMKHPNGMSLKTLILNRNNIYDSGIQNIAIGMFEKYTVLEQQNNQSHQIQMPLEYLGLSDTKISDQGFKYLLQRFEAIYLRNLSNTKDFSSYIDIDVSKNNLTDTSMKYLSDIIKKFNGFRSFNLSSLGKMKETGMVDFLRSLRDSTSLIKLDLSKNSLTCQMLQELLMSLQENFVISEIIVDLKGKSIPFGASNYTLMSMYEIFFSKEAISL